MSLCARRVVLSCVLGVALVAVGCESKAPSASSNGSVPGPKRRVVCTNAAAAEFVCRLIGPERVAGLPEQVDTYATFDAKSRGFEAVPRFPRYLAESVLALKPDLVVTHEWQNADTTSILRKQAIDVLVLKSSTSYEDIRDTIAQLGEALGARASASKLVDDLDARVAKLRATAAQRAKYTAMVYSNDGTGGSTAGAGTTPDTFLRLAGFRNAATEAGIRGHQPIDFEHVLGIDPDFIVVAAQAQGEGGSATKSVLESTPALARLKALRNGRVIVVPAQLMSADSPPLVDAAEIVAAEASKRLPP